MKTGVDWEQLPKIKKIIRGSGDFSGNMDIQVTKFFTRQRKIKPSGMFELFSKYSDDDPDQVIISALKSKIT